MKALLSITFCFIFFIINSCAPPRETTTTTTPQTSNRTMDPALTQELRDAMTPEEVYQAFKDGNQRFLNGNLRYRQFVTEVSQTATGQSPYAIVLGCIDSRVPAETIFDKRIGDIFSTRLAGNVVNEDVLGGMEFACNISGSKLVLVMGHTKCGAIKGAASGVRFGNLTHLINKIEPVVASANNSYNGEQNPEQYEYVDHIAEENVKYVIQQIRSRSSDLARLEREGKIKIAGCMYEIETGRVRFLD